MKLYGKERSGMAKSGKKVRQGKRATRLQRIPKGRETACHEAAHAVVCLAMGWGFKCIRLATQERDDRSWLGIRVEVESVGQTVPTDERIYGDDALKDVKISLAGIAFEKLRCPSMSYLLLLMECLTASDYDNALKMYAYWKTGSPEPPMEVKAMAELWEREIFRDLLPEVRRLVAARWGAILRIGNALAERGELSQPEVEKLLRDEE